MKSIAGVLVGVCAAGCPSKEAAPERTGAPGPAPVGAAAPAPASAPAPAGEQSERTFRAQRERLVAALENDGIRDARVLAALRRVPRHLFVPDAVRELSYLNRPLPIGSGQTISQPYVVAAMSEAAGIEPGEKCLEIGTGSGYQAAVLAELCGKVYSIEYLPDVARFGADNLRRAGYGPERVELRVGDGYAGWPEAAPFDAIVVTAAPERVPPPLLEQLAVRGRMIIPVGRDGDQWLELWTRRAASGPDQFQHERLDPVRFVPFLGDGGR